MSQFKYGFHGQHGEPHDSRHEAVGYLANILRENDYLNPGSAAGFILVIEEQSNHE